MLALLLLALLETSAARAADAGPRPRFDVPPTPSEVQAHEGCFPSGLRVVVQRDARQPVVTVSTTVEGGSAADPPGKEGTAQLLASLAFRARTAKGVRVHDAVRDLGGRHNATTATDATVYATMAPREALRPLLALEAQRLLDPLAGLGEADVAHERAVVLTERRQRIDDTWLAAWRVLTARVFPEGHPYHRLGAVDAPTLGAVALADVRALARSTHRPDRATLHVVGDVEPAALAGLVGEIFPDPLLAGPAGSPARACGPRLPSREDPPPPASVGIAEVPAVVERPTLAVGWSLPGAWRKDDALARFDVVQLQAAIERRLDWYTWQDADLRQGADCHVEPALHASMALCRVELPQGRSAAETLARVSEGAKQVWAADASTRALVWTWTTHAFVAAGLRASETFIDPFGRDGHDLRLRDHFTADPGAATAMARDLLGSNIDQAAVFAQRWLAPDRAAAVLLVPRGEASVAALAAGGAIASDDDEDRPLPSPATPGLDLSALEEFTLPNGLRVVLLPRGDVPTVRVALSVRGGTAQEPAPGLATLASGIAIPRYRNIGFSPRRELFAMGATLTQDEGDTEGRYVATGAAAQLDALLYLLRLRVDDIGPEMDLREDWLDGLDAALAHPSAASRRDAAVRATLWRGHPLGQVVDAALVAGTRRYGDRAVADWIAATHRPEEATLLVVGRFDAAAARAQVEARFGGWRGARVREALSPLGPPPPPPSRTVLGVDAPGRTLTEVGLDCQVGPADRGAPEALEVLDALAQDRAWAALRERAPGSWAPSSTSRIHQGGSARLSLRARVAHAAAPDAARALLDLVAGLAQVGERDVARARRTLALGAPLWQISNDQVLDRLADVVDAQADWALLARRAERLEAVTTAQVRALLGACVDHEVVSLVGPRAALPAEVGGVPVTWEGGAR